ncbi:hypothetical protein Hanom_Chr02g00125901 [Helianthus anomalus]
MQHHGIINPVCHPRVDTSAAHAAAKDEYNNLRLPVIDLVTSALQHENYVDQLKEVFRMKRRLQIMKT